MLEELDLPEDLIESSSNSVGGLVMEILGHIPAEGENAACPPLELSVISVKDKKVEKVMVTIIPTSKDNNSDQ